MTVPSTDLEAQANQLAERKGYKLLWLGAPVRRVFVIGPQGPICMARSWKTVLGYLCRARSFNDSPE